ncbi:hypothetical protein PFBG_05470 [Plasmodium falciparum 7G8]|uniref:Uncharacterized protein n=3 Tax=Plasmodium falciparum TaxID=5833 RepID=A0A024VZT8_PLAFA|nr:hypothetical protein PFTANZ_05386 [Plasmodium falciparum Tanzania (2000708)]ETW58372.1 hypothetical protein PFMC_05475 [Plasmodium falciparum CAMP/Malaysia]EUR62864.1 hypothetical protein PFBG_05470 [Plasmodium falciparum 7G8]
MEIYTYYIYMKNNSSIHFHIRYSFFTFSIIRNYYLFLENYSLIKTKKLNFSYYFKIVHGHLILCK